MVVGHGLRTDAISGEQSWPLQTPNIQKLTQHGLRLVASSACPADPGGMTSLWTGLHARQHGYMRQGDGISQINGWPQLLRESGYHVVGVGRVGAVKHSLDDAVVVEDVGSLESSACRYLQAMAGKGLLNDIVAQRRQRMRYGPFEPDRLVLEPDDDIDGYIAAQASERLDQLSSQKPWALIVAFTGPANDLPAPHMYDDIVEARDLEGGFVPADLMQIDALVELDYPRVLLQRLDRYTIGKIRSDYLGRVSLIDYGVGRLISALQKRDDKERTWVVTTSDRGQLLGEHGVVGHRSFLSAAIEVPVIITPPTPSAESHTDDLTGTVDVATTIAMLGNCDLTSQMRGTNLLPLVGGQPLDRPNTAIISEFGKRLMLETERYKTVFDTERRQIIGIYDLLADPDETQNILGVASGKNLIDAMRWRLADALLPLQMARC